MLRDRIRRAAVNLLVTISLAAACKTHAAEGSVNIGSTRIGTQVTSFRELRDRAVLKQQRDFSCGAAAFATLLNFGFGDPIREEDILEAVFSRADEKQERLIRNKGLSLLDLKNQAEQRGYRANAFRIRADQLRQLKRPVIVFIRPYGYEHFAVLKGIRDGRAYLADPSQGNWRMPFYRFVDMWAGEDGRGVVFAMDRNDGEWLADSPLMLGLAATEPKPEVLSLRQMLEVGRSHHVNEAQKPR